MLKRKDDILLYRLAHAREVFEQEMCTEFEAIPSTELRTGLYVSTASPAHPLSHDWVEIYSWLFSR